MKVRTGFVSNSSTTNFVILGWNLSTLTHQEEEQLIRTIAKMRKIDIDKEAKELGYEDIRSLKWEILEHFQYKTIDICFLGENHLGYIIAQSETYGGFEDSREIDWNQLTDIILQLVEVAGDLDLPEPKLLVGQEIA